MISPAPGPVDPSIAALQKTGEDHVARHAAGSQAPSPAAAAPPQRRAAPVEPSSFLGAAKAIVTDALREFGRELRHTLEALGFDGETIGEMAKALLDPIREALRSGADFSASLFFAAASRQTTIADGGVTGSLDLIFSSLEITVNHGTGTIEIDTGKVAIESHAEASFGADQPQILDVADTDAPAPVDVFGEFQTFLDRLLDREAADDALGPSDAAPTAGTVPAAGANAEAPAARARISVVAFEQYLNSRGERISRITLDAVIPLVRAAPGTPADALGGEAAGRPVDDEGILV